MDCIFCEYKEKGKFLLENELAFAIYDGFPVSKGHTLVIPKRHCVTYFDLTSEEAAAMQELAVEVKKILDKEYHPDGYNIGLNCGEFAGQTVWHCHMHIIPRYKGDIENPRGGVRKIIVSESKY